MSFYFHPDFLLIFVVVVVGIFLRTRKVKIGFLKNY